MKPEALEYRTPAPADGGPPVARRTVQIAQPAQPAQIGQPQIPRQRGGNLPRFIFWLVILAALVVGGWFVVRQIRQGATATSTGRGSMRGGVPPVVVAQAHTGDVADYLVDTGTVVPFNMVTIRTRVDGQLINVAFKEGQIVKKGDLLAEIDPAPFKAQLTQAQGQLARDQALLQNARLDLQRYLDAPQETFSQQQIDTQKSVVNQFEGIVKSDEGAVQNTQVTLNYATIRAETDGRIGLRNVDPGNIVHAGDTNGLAVIAQLQPIAVIFSIVQGDIGKVMKGASAVPPLEVTALDQDLNLNKTLARGTLVAIDSQVTPGTNRLRLKAQFENTDNALYPNEFVNARLLVDTRKNMVLVPSPAVQRGPDNMFVYVVGPDDKVEARTVVVWKDDGDNAAITSGLAAGETVVTDGVDKLQPDMTVRIAQSDTTQPSGSTRPSGRGRGAGRRGGSGGATGGTRSGASGGGAGGGGASGGGAGNSQ